jgi:hypothetical protein
MGLLVVFLAGCQGRNAALEQRISSGGDVTTPKDSADSVLLTPRVVTGPTVIVFWLVSADTLPTPDQASALDDLTYYTDRVAPTLARHDIKLIPTNADTVYVTLPDRQRRAILLSAVDYPFGYVLVRPDSEERILAGVYADDELLDEIEAYFELPESRDSSSARVRIST